MGGTLNHLYSSHHIAKARHGVIQFSLSEEKQITILRDNYIIMLISVGQYYWTSLVLFTKTYNNEK